MNWILKIYRKVVPEEVRRTYNKFFQKVIIVYRNKRAMRKQHYG